MPDFQLLTSHRAADSSQLPSEPNNMTNPYWLYVVMVIATVSSPGPGVLMTLDNAVAKGWRGALAGVAGLAVGAAIMAGLTAAGIGLLVRSSQPLFLFLKYCGVLYLFYLAYVTWNRDVGSIARQAASGRRADQAGRWTVLLRGVLLQTSNPKSLLFFFSVLPQVVASTPASRPLPLPVAIATYCIVLVLVHASYAALAARARTWLSQPPAARLLSCLSATMFLLFGITLLSLAS
jgi:threonine/homoserine/homoserine lactone efflux protein